MKISKEKKYRLRNGSQYRLYDTDAGGKFSIHGAYSDDGNIWIPITHDDEGWYCKDVNYDLTLAKKSPYEDFKIDDPCLFWDEGSDSKCKGYFAGLNDNGEPTSFAGGRTSFTSKEHVIPWDFCEKWEEGENG